jgi:membrane fusion protein, multidrug efflux system
MYREDESDSHSSLLTARPAEARGENVPQSPAGTASPAPRTAAPQAEKRPARTNRRKVLLGTLLVLVAGGGGWFGYDWWTVGRFTVSTDDAYVQAYNTTLAAKVSGYIASIPVVDNAYVHAGDVIATIDDGDYRLAVDSARGKVETQQATIARIGHQITAQQAAVEQARTQLVSAQAAAKRMELELDRQNMLVARDASSRQLLRSNPLRPMSMF